jgi:DNA-binding response OmpR family regulator
LSQRDRLRRDDFGSVEEMNPQAKRLLIVENDLATLFALRAMFEARGWNVKAARSAVAGLTLCNPELDWIILDLAMPDAEGETLLRRFREAAPSTPIAALAWELDSRSAAALLQHRPLIVLPRPVDFTQLYSACVGIRPAAVTAEVFNLVDCQSDDTAQVYRNGQIQYT